VEKANKHSGNIPQSRREEMDQIEFAGMSEEAIEDEHNEFVCLSKSKPSPSDLHATCNM